MQMLLYLPLAAVLYGILAERTDRAVERENAEASWGRPGPPARR